MTGIIKVDTIQNIGGTTGLTIDSSGGILMPNTDNKIATASLSGTSTLVSVDPSNFNHLLLHIYGSNSASNYELSLRFNSDSGTNYKYVRSVEDANGSPSVDGGQTTSLYLNQTGASGHASGTTNNYHIVKVFFPNNTSVWKGIEATNIYDTGSQDVVMFLSAFWRNTAAVSSVQVIGSQSLTAGTIDVYGCK
tara:strand:+ start:676 stop:1254 length:579 start_codon:yes stop_codon:yes gene_type:complete